jgi:hypothetical protein
MKFLANYIMKLSYQINLIKEDLYYNSFQVLLNLIKLDYIKYKYL